MWCFAFPRGFGLRFFSVTHIAPHAVLLRRSFSLWLGKISAHWRAKTIRMRQVVNLFGSLASGVPWTFLLNSILVLMCLASCSQPWDCAILGGEDLAVGQLLTWYFWSKIPRVSQLFEALDALMVWWFGSQGIRKWFPGGDFPKCKFWSFFFGPAFQ